MRSKQRGVRSAGQGRSRSLRVRQPGSDGSRPSVTIPTVESYCVSLSSFSKSDAGHSSASARLSPTGT